MEDPRILPFQTPIQYFGKMGNSDLYIKREDRIFFSQGTKIRKLWGIYNSLVEKVGAENIRKIVLQGNLHSNAVLAGCLFFQWAKIPTKVFGYSRDINLKSPASILVRRFSESEIFETRVNWLKKRESIAGNLKPVMLLSSPEISLDDYVLFESTKEKGIFYLPEYLFCSESFSGLDLLWKETTYSEFDSIFLDLGTGLTWLSALKHYSILPPVYGLSLGLKLPKLRSWLEERIQNLSFSLKPSWKNIFDAREIDPKNSYKFGEMDRFWEELSKNYFKRSGIYFEPVYSAKSIRILELLIQKEILKGKILYIHQGGILQSFTGI
ncbi:1-aminocyclopropane-1-carboxylate deaminase [Leptospira johnsonii]|nr:1-aminocyclopropane-1-carboxylate deaminase [Leptospira johnsonii]